MFLKNYNLKNKTAVVTGAGIGVTAVTCNATAPAARPAAGRGRRQTQQ